MTAALPTPFLTTATLTPLPPIKGCGNDGNWKNENDCLHPFDICKGDCDNDDDCAGDLICYQRGRNQAVPGCSGGELNGSLFDYCIRPINGGGDGSTVDDASPTVSFPPSISKLFQPYLLLRLPLHLLFQQVRQSYLQ